MILKTRDLIEKSTEDLQEELEKLNKEYFEANMSFNARKLENTSSLREYRKSIARINTILEERNSSGDSAAQEEGGEEA